MITSEHHANGRSPTWRYVAGVAIALLLTIAGYLYGQTQDRINRNEDRDDLTVQLSTATAELARNTALRIDGVDARLKRIEDQLDRLLERRR